MSMFTDSGQGELGRPGRWVTKAWPIRTPGSAHSVEVTANNDRLGSVVRLVARSATGAEIPSCHQFDGYQHGDGLDQQQRHQDDQLDGGSLQR